ncbi:MAG: glycosyltransferase family 2 protein [Clostridium sp.]|nr:glycosyltransferase family 2 protein [Clostridium sp.]
MDFDVSKCKHMFSVCAYKESPYLEKCIISLRKQTKQSDIIVCTSTPCTYITNIAEKYDVPLYVREGKSNIKDDWNFAYNCAEADFVTVAHQDDEYSQYYVEELYKKLSRFSKREQIIMVLTDYLPLKNRTGIKRDINSRIRRILRIPLKWTYLAGKKQIKKWVLALGNSICCPTVAYNKKNIGDDLFVSDFKFNIDWDTFLMLANKEGIFLYIDKPLVYYRIHDGATSKNFIENNLRIDEDVKMFNRFWPDGVTRILMIFYKKAYDTYNE